MSPSVIDQFNHANPQISLPLGTLDPLKAFIWAWYDKNKHMTIAKYKILFITFDIKLENCKRILELILGER